MNRRGRFGLALSLLICSTRRVSAVCSPSTGYLPDFFAPVCVLPAGFAVVALVWAGFEDFGLFDAAMLLLSWCSADFGKAASRAKRHERPIVSVSTPRCFSDSGSGRRALTNNVHATCVPIFFVATALRNAAPGMDLRAVATAAANTRVGWSRHNGRPRGVSLAAACSCRGRRQSVSRRSPPGASQYAAACPLHTRPLRWDRRPVRR